MAHVYEVTLTNGTRYDVTSDRHHSQMTEQDFQWHLLQIIRDAIPSIISGVVVGIVLKGIK